MPRLPVVPPWTGDLPPAEPPAGMALYQLPTGTYDARAALTVRGGSFFDVRHLAATAVLVRHPKGDLLIDAGFGTHVAEHVAMLPRIARAPYHPGATAAAQLDLAGHPRERLLGVLLTHTHWDHVSGLDGLDVPVLVNAAERQYAATDPDGAVFRSLSPGLDVRDYALDGTAYLGFGPSWDVHGDGSVVVALAGGHTSGSVVVFVTLPSGRRWGFVGDLTWQLDGIRRHAERPWLLRRLADSDPAQVRRGLAQAIALSGRVRIVPAHDLAAYDGIPPLTVGSLTSPSAT